ncbi:hypothetical protein ABBQ38_013902 [Trebouxia sp. C0009 RCD-2024]
MALVPHASNTDQDETKGAIVAIRGAQELTQEEYEQRIKDAEVLEEKLKFITEKIPTRIMNVAGSNAGAGSGEFHMYRQARRREVMRQQRIEEEAVADAAEREYQERKDKLAREEEERTAKRRAKRQKKKAAKKVFMAANGSNSPGSGLTTQQKLCQMVPPFQTLAHPDHATEPTRYSHLHLNGLPASQSAAASPLGFLNNKLMAFGQSETLNGRNRDKSELQDELLRDIPGLETVEYLKTGRPAKLKLPPVAVLTFRTRKSCS